MENKFKASGVETLELERVAALKPRHPIKWVVSEKLELQRLKPNRSCELDVVAKATTHKDSRASKPPLKSKRNALLRCGDGSCQEECQHTIVGSALGNFEEHVLAGL